MARSELTDVGERTREAEQLLSVIVFGSVTAATAWAGVGPARTAVVAATASTMTATARRRRMRGSSLSVRRRTLAEWAGDRHRGSDGARTLASAYFYVNGCEC